MDDDDNNTIDASGWTTVGVAKDGRLDQDKGDTALQWVFTISIEC